MAWEVRYIGPRHGAILASTQFRLKTSAQVELRRLVSDWRYNRGFSIGDFSRHGEGRCTANKNVSGTDGASFTLWERHSRYHAGELELRKVEP